MAILAYKIYEILLLWTIQYFHHLHKNVKYTKYNQRCPVHACLWYFDTQLRRFFIFPVYTHRSSILYNLGVWR